MIGGKIRSNYRGAKVPSILKFDDVMKVQNQRMFKLQGCNLNNFVYRRGKLETANITGGVNIY